MSIEAPQYVRGVIDSYSRRILTSRVSPFGNILLGSHRKPVESATAQIAIASTPASTPGGMLRIISPCRQLRILTPTSPWK